MDEYIEREGIKKSIKFFFDIRLKVTHSPIEIKQLVLDVIDGERAADVQPLSVVAEHIKNRLYETAFNTTEEKARNAIADMAERIDFWIDELKDGEQNE